MKPLLCTFALIGCAGLVVAAPGSISARAYSKAAAGTLMPRRPVRSSDLASVGYDAENSVLEVEFVNGGAIYQYFGVPQAVYRALMSAQSHGRYFAANIKDTYRYSRVN